MLYVTEKKVYLHFFLLVNYMHQMGFESKTSPSFHESNEELPFEPGIFVHFLNNEMTKSIITQIKLFTCSLYEPKYLYCNFAY